MQNFFDKFPIFFAGYVAKREQILPFPPRNGKNCSLWDGIIAEFSKNLHFRTAGRKKRSDSATGKSGKRSQVRCFCGESGEKGHYLCDGQRVIRDERQ